ncbi:MAG TPA: U32 family peptidase [Verrucomicrobiales bacterium]|nr:U32 family peptidase [Verrucomicrobiales bacterium]
MTDSPTWRKPELLAPAGDWECARAAVANGADAIYFGLDRFNARLRAENFTAEDLPKLMAFLHSHGVKGYVTFNTLIFTGELQDAAAMLVTLEQSGVDAVIVQDLGLAWLARRVSPTLAVHASTQMTITSPEALAFVESVVPLDCAVLARELSLREMERFHATDEGSTPLEVFVHGALCVAYSGQCLTSESLGQRSANRGECAQACRMPYTMIVNGEVRDLGDRRYLLSPHDLAGHAEVPGLIRAGIATLKIEGRLKSPEYVAGVTAVYRKAIDAAWAEFRGEAAAAVDAEDIYTLEMTFSRGLSSGWLRGTNHPSVVTARYGKKRGAFIGTVEAMAGGCVGLRCEVPLKPGDGVVFDTGGDTELEQGGSLYEVWYAEGLTWLGFQHGRINWEGIREGDRVWKTSDPALNRSLQSTWARIRVEEVKQPLQWRVSGREGELLILEDAVSGGQVTSTMALGKAEKRPLTAEFLEQQLGRLGGTPYTLGSLDVGGLDPGLMLPVSELNRMRRSLVAILESVSVYG